MAISALTTAIPVCAPLSTSLTLANGPLKSTRADTRVPLPTPGAGASSSMPANAGLLLASSTGASLTLLTVRTKSLKALAPCESVAVTRTVMEPTSAFAGVPLKWRLPASKTSQAGSNAPPGSVAV